MSIVTYPLNNVQYTAADAEIYNSTRTSGVYANSDNLDISITGARSISISPGMAWIKNDDFAGKAIAVKSAIELTLDAPNSSLSRIDRVVLGFNAANNSTSIYVKKGELSTNPTAPNITQTPSLYELGLYDISIPAGLVNLTTNNIIDQRSNEKVCGIMSDGVTSIRQIDEAMSDTSENTVQNKVIKKYVDDNKGKGTITEIAINGSTLATNGKADIPAATTSKYGATKLNSATNSTSVTEAATPSAVKAAYDKADSALPKSGGTMTGPLTLNGDPSSNMHAATKQYVDNNKGGNGTITKVQVNGTDVASSGTANIPAASTSKYGATKLSSATNSTSTSLAATPSAVKEAYDKANTAQSTASAAQSTANAAMPKSGGTFTGAVVAQNNTNYTTKQVRNIFLVADGNSLPSGSNGDICLVYAP